jgi:Co/Zn/Cd efflux system component
VRFVTIGALMAIEAVNFFRAHWGDIANTASVAGFIFAICTLLRIKRTGEQVKAATIEIRERLTRTNSVAEFAAAVQIVEEIKRLHRIGAWETSLDRYSAVRRLLVSIQESSSKITEAQRTVLASSIEQFRVMEQTVERARSRNPPGDPDLARLNKTASKILDELNSVMISIRQAVD